MSVSDPSHFEAVAVPLEYEEDIVDGLPYAPLNRNTCSNRTNEANDLRVVASHVFVIACRGTERRTESFLRCRGGIIYCTLWIE